MEEMMTYRAPVNDILNSMAHNAGLNEAIASGLYAGDLGCILCKCITGSG